MIPIVPRYAVGYMENKRRASTLKPYLSAVVLVAPCFLAFLVPFLIY